MSDGNHGDYWANVIAICVGAIGLVGAVSAAYDAGVSKGMYNMHKLLTDKHNKEKGK